MNFNDMLTKLITTEPDHMEVVEIVPTAPEGITVGEELISW